MNLTLLQIGGAMVGSVVGAGVGFSQLLCPDGGCAITGTWFGGAAMGGAMGFAVVGMLPIFVKAEPAGEEQPSNDAKP